MQLLCWGHGHPRKRSSFSWCRRQSCGSGKTSHFPPHSGLLSISMKESHELHQPLFNYGENWHSLESLFKTNSQAPRPKLLILQTWEGARKSTVVMNTSTLLQPKPMVCLPGKNPSYSKIWWSYKSLGLPHCLTHHSINAASQKFF